MGPDGGVSNHPQGPKRVKRRASSEAPAPAANGGRKGRRVRRVRPRFVWTLAVFVVAVVLGVSVLAAGGPSALVFDVAGSVFASSFQQAAKGAVQAAPPKPQSPFTVLVMGTEQTNVVATAQNAFQGENTDSMIVLAYDPRLHMASILSVPRDLWVDIPGYGYQRINVALEVGGPALAEKTVAETIGAPIDYYAVVGYSALVDVVNAVGGINVDVPYNIDDTCFPNAAENACTTFRISAGWHHLNGTTALELAREREVLPLSDLSRDADQQLILFALRKALLSPFGLFKVPELVRIVSHSVQTNFPLASVPALAAQVLRLSHSQIKHAVLQYSNGAVSNWTTPGGAEVLLPHPAHIQAVVEKVLGPMLPGLQAAASGGAPGTGGSSSGSAHGASTSANGGNVATG